MLIPTRLPLYLFLKVIEKEPVEFELDEDLPDEILNVQTVIKTVKSVLLFDN